MTVASLSNLYELDKRQAFTYSIEEFLMRKEPLIAIFIGSLIGIGVAFVAWKASQMPIQSNPEITSTPAVQNNSANLRISENGLSIVSPISERVVTKNSLEISGIATSADLVTVTNGTTTTVAAVPESGEFTQTISLSPGLNQIYVSSFTDTVIAQAQIEVVYSPEFEENPPTTTETSDQSINVANELKTAQSLFFRGNVTDIAEASIQMRDEDDQIQQISLDTETTYANSTTETRDIEFNEVALGDYILALGYLDERGVLKAQRVLVITSPSPSTYTALYGTITTLSNKEFIVKNADGVEYSIDATGKVSVTRFDENGEIIRARLAESSESEKIIVIGKNDEEIDASHIHIFPGNN